MHRGATVDRRNFVRLYLTLATFDSNIQGITFQVLKYKKNCEKIVFKIITTVISQLNVFVSTRAQ